MKIPKHFHCLNNAYIENKTPNIHIIFEEVHRVNACDMQKA